MAEERLTLATLRKLLSTRTSVSERKTGEYLNALFGSIVEGLRADGVVKINGLGTFKVQWNAPRKSVNVQTGENIIIDGYNKVVFTPETTLKNRINEPFAHLEAIVIGEEQSDVKAGTDPMQKLGEQADEIKDLLAELGALSDESQVKERQDSHNKPIEQDGSNDERKNVVVPPSEEKNDRVAEAEDNVSRENKGTKPLTEEVKTLPKDEIKVSNPPQKEKTPTKAFHPWKVAGITILCFCVVLVGGYFFLQHKITSWADSLLEKEERGGAEKVQPKPIENVADAVIVVDSVASSFSDTTCAQCGEQQAEVSVDSVNHQERIYTEFITTETLTEGSRLTWLSRKYYGAPDFWVYIYEANQDILPDPNNISVGTRLRIPRLPKEWIDVRNEKSMRQAEEMHKAILKDF